MTARLLKHIPASTSYFIIVWKAGVDFVTKKIARCGVTLENYLLSTTNEYSTFEETKYDFCKTVRHNLDETLKNIENAFHSTAIKQHPCTLILSIIYAHGFG